MSLEITKQLSRQMYSGHCQTFEMESFVKRIMSDRVLARNQKFFRTGEVLWNWNTSINISLKIQEKKDPHGNTLDFFLPDTHKATSSMEILTQRLAPTGLFSKIRTLFLIFKNNMGGVHLPPSCASVSVPEYASITLSIPKYLWKYQRSKYA